MNQLRFQGKNSSFLSFDLPEVSKKQVTPKSSFCLLLLPAFLDASLLGSWQEPFCCSFVVFVLSEP